ncbi:uncharacterized protein LOC108676183 isoform X2 [Hyalella azteca]|uniref:Uncharacterized protein LOC108676183 isoform X2 n=1 Tax=Hyalella azteca TaxID=294128 RepID=A0A979FRI1_HYAAZ|nr:uncharacterized protein LOC108676183 isoform X2 [Hyalella azteca]
MEGLAQWMQFKKPSPELCCDWSLPNNTPAAQKWDTASETPSDLIMVGEFSELKGPIPLMTFPSLNPTCKLKHFKHKPKEELTSPLHTCPSCWNRNTSIDPVLGDVSHAKFWANCDCNEESGNVDNFLEKSTLKKQVFKCNKCPCSIKMKASKPCVSCSRNESAQQEQLTDDEEDESLGHSFCLDDDPFYCGIDLNDLVLKLMSTDYQNFGGVFNLPKDSEVIELDLQNQFTGISAVVRYVTLFDIHARGYVRPHCIAYLTWDQAKIHTSLDVIRSHMKKASDYLKSSNLCWFAWESKKRLADLQYTKQRYLKALQNARNIGGSSHPGGVASDSRCGSSGPETVSPFSSHCASGPDACASGPNCGASSPDFGASGPDHNASHPTCNASGPVCNNHSRTSGSVHNYLGSFCETSCPTVTIHNSNDEQNSISAKCPSDCASSPTTGAPKFTAKTKSLSLEQSLRCKAGLESESLSLGHDSARPGADPDVLQTSVGSQDPRSCGSFRDLPDVCSGIEIIGEEVHVPSDWTDVTEADFAIAANKNQAKNSLSYSTRQVGNDHFMLQRDTDEKLTSGVWDRENGRTGTEIISNHILAAEPGDDGPKTEELAVPGSQIKVPPSEILSPKLGSPEKFPIHSKLSHNTEIPAERNPSLERTDNLLLDHCSLEAIATQLLDTRRIVSVVCKHLESLVEFTEVKELTNLIANEIGSPVHRAAEECGMLNPAYCVIPSEEENWSSDDAKEFPLHREASSFLNSHPVQDVSAFSKEVKTKFPLGNESFSSNDQKENVSLPIKDSQGNFTQSCRRCRGSVVATNSKIHGCGIPELYFGSSGRRRYESLRCMRDLSGCGFVAALLELSELHSILAKSSLALAFEIVDEDCYLYDPGSLFVGNVPVVNIVKCSSNASNDESEKMKSKGKSDSMATNLHTSSGISRSSRTLPVKVNLTRGKAASKSSSDAQVKMSKNSNESPSLSCSTLAKKFKFKASLCYNESIVDQILNIYVDKKGLEKPLLENQGDWVLINGRRIAHADFSLSRAAPPLPHNHNTKQNISQASDFLQNIDTSDPASSSPDVSGPLCLLMSASTLSSHSGGTASSSYETDNKIEDNIKSLPVEVAIAADESFMTNLGLNASNEIIQNTQLLTPSSNNTDIVQEGSHKQRHKIIDRALSTPASSSSTCGCRISSDTSCESKVRRSSCCCCKHSQEPKVKKKKKKKYRRHPRVDIDQRMATAYYHELSALLLKVPGKSKNKLALSNVSQSLMASLLSGRRLIVAARPAHQRAAKMAVTAMAAALLPVAQDNLHPITKYHRGTITSHHLRQQPLLGLCIPERLLLHHLIDSCTMSKITTVNLSSGHISGVAYYGNFIRGLDQFIRHFCPREADPQQAIRQWFDSTLHPASMSYPVPAPELGDEQRPSDSDESSRINRRFERADSSPEVFGRVPGRTVTATRDTSSEGDHCALESNSDIVDVNQKANAVVRSISSPEMAHDLFCVNPSGRGGASLLNTACEDDDTSTIPPGASALASSQTSYRLTRSSSSAATNMHFSTEGPYASSRSSYRDIAAMSGQEIFPSASIPAETTAKSSVNTGSFRGESPSVNGAISVYGNRYASMETFRRGSVTSETIPLYGNSDAPLQTFLQSLLVKLGVQVFLYFHVSGNSTFSPSQLMHVLDVRERNDMQILEYLTSIVSRQLDLADVQVEYLP